MKFEITVNHNKKNTNKAIEIIDNLKSMARKSGLDLSSELDIKIGQSENDTIFIVPNIMFADGELFKGKSEEFTKNYLEAFATADGVVVDFGNIITIQ